MKKNMSGTNNSDKLNLQRNPVKIFYLLLLLSSITFAQSKTTAIVEYKIFNNNDIPNTLFATVFVNNGITIYLPKYSTQFYNNYDQEAKRTKRIIADTDYLMIDHRRNEIFSFENLGFNKVIVKDDYNNFKWDITEETKTIGNYQCIKATITYRGMDWIVWFAPEIALPYGPWKLHGLPGLIMEAYDKEKTFTFSLEKIEYRKDAIFDKDFTRLVETKNKKPIAKREFIEKQDEFEANQDAEMMLSTSGIVKITKVSRGGYELKYEWEK